MARTDYVSSHAAARRGGRARAERFLAVAELASLALILPLTWYPTAVRFAALLVIPLFWAVRWRLVGHFVHRTPLDTALLLLLMMVVVSLYATYDINVSLPKVAGMLLGLGLFYATVAYGSGSTGAVRQLLLAYLGLGCALAGVALLGMRWSGKLPFLEPIIAVLPARLIQLPGAPQGIQPNEVAGTLLWIVPLAASVAVVCWQLAARPGQNRLWGWLRALGASLLALALLGVLVLTQSRAGLVGMAAALAMLVVATLRGRWRGAALIAAGIALALAVAAGWWFVSDAAVGDDYSDVPELGIDARAMETLDGRLEIWSRALYGIQDFPFTGMGMNTFRTIVHILYPLFLISPDTDIGHAHNIWLQAALDLGIPGLIAFCAVWIMAARMLADVLRRSADIWLRGVAAGLASCLAGYFIYGLVDTVALGARPGFLWWMLLGLLVATWKLALGGPKSSAALQS